MKLLHGTSSWSEKSWVGPFYPAGTKPADMLAFYATQFPTVEADTTYYRIPPREMVRGWRTRTPEGFVVSAKFPRSVVHGGEGSVPDATKLLEWSAVGGDVERFLDAMAELGAKQGPLVVQLPYLNRNAFAGVEPFLERLAAFLEKLPKGPRYGVEVRNKNWIGEALLALLRARGIALVLVDIAYMPHPAFLAERHDLVTADFAYARLIGDRKAVEAKTETFDRIVLDQSENLARWAELLESIGSRVRETFAYANNHYAGFGPATIRDLVRRLSGE
jgi:uncharacterized protein YecE (DUF72 family)